MTSRDDARYESGIPRGWVFPFQLDPMVVWHNNQDLTLVHFGKHVNRCTKAFKAKTKLQFKYLPVLNFKTFEFISEWPREQMK